MNIAGLLEGHSKAMYSTYFLWKPDNIMFDCGEGAATNLGSKVFASDYMFLSHGHLDHISGIPNFLFARSGGRGDNAKPLKVYYPQGDENITHMITFCKALQAHGHDSLSFDLQWIALEPNQRVQLNANKYVETFQTFHAKNRLTIGYRINEQRKKLKPEFVGLDQHQILAAIQKYGKDGISTVEQGTTFVYTGDTHVLEQNVYGNPQVLLHESTFINRDDVKYDTHSVLDDVLEMVQKINPDTVLLYHFSTRYSAAQVSLAVKTLCEAMQLNINVWLMYGRYLWQAHARA